MSWITLEEAKTRLGIDCTDPSQDADVQAAVDYAIAIVEEYCQRNFAEQQQTEAFFKPGNTIYLKNWPVASIDELQVDGEVITPEYTIDMITGTLYLKAGTFNQYSDDLLSVQYTAGYNPVPLVLKNAALDVVNARYQTADEDPTRGPVKFERIDGSVSVSYGDPGVSSEGSAYGALQSYRMIIDMYRSERTQGVWTPYAHST